VGAGADPEQRLGRLSGRHRQQVLPPVEESGQAARSLIGALEASTRFRCDGRLGRIFHPGKVSYRELSPTNSLHVIIGKGQVSAHVDDISPLRGNADGSAHYSWVPVLRHNLAGMLADLGRRAQGTHGHQRCNLTCEAVWVDDEGIADLIRAAGSSSAAPTDGAADQP